MEEGSCSPMTEGNQREGESYTPSILFENRPAVSYKCFSKETPPAHRFPSRKHHHEDAGGVAEACMLLFRTF